MAANREIRRIRPEDMDEYMKVYTGSYTAFKDWSDSGYAEKQASLTESLLEDEHIQFFGLFEDGTLIATMRLVDYEIGLFGELGRACGLASLAVHGMHRGKKAALDMVRFFENYTLESGADLALLLPFTMKFYRKMGYGFQSKMFRHSLPTKNLPACKDKPHLVMLSRADEAEILECQREYSRRNHGSLVKFEDDIRNFRGGDTVRWVGVREDGCLTGYMSIVFSCDSETNYTLNCMNVTELVYENPTAFRELLGYLYDQADQAQRVTILTGEEDFYHILMEAADTSGNYIDFGGLQTGVTAMNIMHKLVDPEKFVRDTAYRRFPMGEMTVCFQYEDAYSGEEKAMTVRIADHRWELLPAGTKSDVTVSTSQAELASILMGSAGIAALVRLGAAKVSEPALLQDLDALFHVPQKPYGNSDF